MDRIILLIDMDCFYVQVEQRLHPETVGLPCAVVQYTSVSLASIIAVSYEAREKGVERSMNGDAAKKHCADLLLFQVPMRRGKADLTKYRDASAEVIKSISKFSSKVERASIDEAYIDVTDLLSSDLSDYPVVLSKSNLVVDPDSMKHFFSSVNSRSPPYSFPIDEVLGQIDVIENLSNGRNFRQALCLAQKVKDQIFADTGFRCSIGISANRMLSKIACSLNKPDKITLVPLESAQHLMCYTRVKKVPGLGGKLGSDLASRFNLEFIGSLADFPVSKLIEDYGEKTGKWLYELCRGIDFQAVSVRTLVKSIACSKNFPGKSALKSDVEVLQWLTNLAGELVERIAIDRADHNRLPAALSLSVRADLSEVKSKSLNPNILASIPPRAQGDHEKIETEIAERLAEMALSVIKSFVGAINITHISLSAGKLRSDHSAACGDVKKLLNEQSKPVKRESFFRQFIEKELKEAETTPPKKQLVEPCVQDASMDKKQRLFFQHHGAIADTILCEECGSRVMAHLVQEHSDFHFARKMQQEWNKEMNPPTHSQLVATSSIPSRGVKRGRGRGQKALGHTKIDSFLIKRN